MNTIFYILRSMKVVLVCHGTGTSAGVRLHLSDELLFYSVHHAHLSSLEHFLTPSAALLILPERT